MSLIDYFKEKLRKKRKLDDIESDDHPMHEKYVDQEPVKK